MIHKGKKLRVVLRGRDHAMLVYDVDNNLVAQIYPPHEENQRDEIIAQTVTEHLDRP